MVHTSQVQSFTILALPDTGIAATNGATNGQDPVAWDFVPPRVDVKAVREREEAAVHRARVGTEGCAIFDALLRT